MVSAASPRAAEPKILDLPASKAHASSSYACAQDEYFKCPHKTSIDGDKRLDSGWNFDWFWHQRTFDMRLTRQHIVDMLCLCLPVAAAVA